MDEEVISILLLRSACGCKNRNCFANYRTSMLEPVAAIIKVRQQRLEQGFTRGNKGEGPWLARKLMDCRRYVGGNKPYRIDFVFNNVPVCRHVWECLHGLPPASSRISNYIAMINKGKDPSLAHLDRRCGEKATDRNLQMETWARKHILMTAECSPVGSEPMMHVLKMTTKERHLVYVKETEQERRSGFGPAQPALSPSQFNKLWKKIMSQPYLHPRTQQYYELRYRTHLSRGFNECDTCARLRATLAEGDPATHDVTVTLQAIEEASCLDRICCTCQCMFVHHSLFVCMNVAQKGFQRCQGNVSIHQSRGFQRSGR